MKIFICTSKWLYHKVSEIKSYLESKGHIITLPNSYDNPMKEEEMKLVGKEEHAEWKSSMIKLQETKIQNCDAILVLNYEKNGQQNYIGGATFLEIYETYKLGKRIYFMNPIPESILKDELLSFKPIIINGNLELIQ